MNFKELLEKELYNPDDCPSVLLRGACRSYINCKECKEAARHNILELLERDYVEKERDTLKKIKEDALLPFYDYWKCRDTRCNACPTLIDGKRPCDVYATEGSCSKAQTLDLLRRQRELLEVEEHAN